MACCCPHSRSAGRIFSFFARRYRRRFQKKGFEPSQKQLLDGIRAAGFKGASLLEIGCGVGALHQYLLEQGAGRAVGIDLAEKMLAEARDWARQRGLAERTEYVLGDFVAIEATIEPAEIVILDKVICCYPDAAGLVAGSAAKAKRVYAFTLPRDRWYTRAGAAFGALLMWLIRSDFRAYVHDPQAVHAALAARGLRQQYESTTFLWLTRVYARA